MCIGWIGSVADDAYLLILGFVVKSKLDILLPILDTLLQFHEGVVIENCIFVWAGFVFLWEANRSYSYWLYSFKGSWYSGIEEMVIEETFLLSVPGVVGDCHDEIAWNEEGSADEFTAELMPVDQ